MESGGHLRRLTGLVSGLCLLASFGCVTGTDLEKLDAKLNARLDALDDSMQARIQELRSDLGEQVTGGLEASQRGTLAAVERLETSLARATETTRQTVVEYAARSEEHLDRIAELTAALQHQLQGVQAAVKQTLLGTYEAEEAALRERLKVLSRIRQELETAAENEPEGGGAPPQR